MGTTHPPHLLGFHILTCSLGRSSEWSVCAESPELILHEANACCRSGLLGGCSGLTRFSLDSRRPACPRFVTIRHLEPPQYTPSTGQSLRICPVFGPSGLGAQRSHTATEPGEGLAPDLSTSNVTLCTISHGSVADNDNAR